MVLFSVSTVVAGDKYAMVVSVRAGDQQLSDTNRDYCKETISLLGKAGFSADNISTYFEGGAQALPGSEDVTSSAVLAKLQELSQKVTPEDELWFFLYGYAGVSSRGISIATKGKRMRGSQLVEALDSIKSKQRIFALNRMSSPLMGLLSDRSNRIVITATSTDKQLNPPLYAKYLLKEWSADPDQPIIGLLRKAGDALKEFYDSGKMAIPEVSQVFDGKQICEYPYKGIDAVGMSDITLSGKTSSLVASSAKPVTGEKKKYKQEHEKSESPDKLDFSEFDKPESETDETEESPLLAATAETEQQIEQARMKGEKYSGFMAYYLNNNINFTVNTDRSSTMTQRYEIFLKDDIASEFYARLSLSDYPLEEELTVEKARIIYPDGTYRDIDPNQVSSRTSGLRYNHLKFPGATSGCLIQVELEYSRKPQSQLPEYQKMFSLQKHVPVESSSLIINVPKKQYYNYKLYRSDKKPVVTETEYSRVIAFEFGSIAALEPLPYDPPQIECMTRLQLSSLESWGNFRKWCDRILFKSDVVDEKTVEFTKELTKDCATDAEKVKAIYEFLCDLRYETTPIGARAFRPRLPQKVCSEKYGDCKDKANALVAMSRCVGVDGSMALVNRMSSTDASFPAWQFNHAVAFFTKLEGYPDGLWCDATDGSTPFGSLPPGDIGRSAFVLENPTSKFRTIRLSDKSINSIEQTVNLEVDSDSSVDGTIRLKMTGLADYYLRRSLKHSSPLQIRSIVQRLVGHSFVGLSVDDVKLSPLTKLHEPLVITARCFCPEWSLVRNTLRSPYDLWNPVAAPDRDRPLLLNDGQPLTITQRIHVKGDRNRPESNSWNRESQFVKASVNYVAEEKSWRREVCLDLITPKVDVEDYQDFRKQVMELYGVMSQ